MEKNPIEPNFWKGRGKYALTNMKKREKELKKMPDQVEIYKGIRKEMPPPTKAVPSGKNYKRKPRSQKRDDSLKDLEASLLDRIKNLYRRIKDRVIRSKEDFLQVQRETGNMVIDFNDIVRSSLDLLEKIGKVIEVDNRKVIEGPQRSTEIDRYTPPSYRGSVEGEIPPEHIDEKYRGILDSYVKKLGWTEEDIRNFFNENFDESGRVLLTAKEAIKKGNKKIDPRIGIWVLPCSLTCPASTQFCREYCYAKKAEGGVGKQTVIPSRLRKYLLSLQEDFVGEMAEAISSSGLDLVRIHESGDFYSERYLMKWIEIARKCPNTKFYSYTKAEDVLANVIQELRKKKVGWPKNFVLQGSVEPSMQVKRVWKKDKKTIKREKEVLRGTPLEKVKRMWGNPRIAGLSIILPQKKMSFEEAIAEVAEVIAPDDENIREDIIKNTFLCPGHCGIAENLEDVNQIMADINEKCPFCYLTREERERIFGKRHVAFLIH